MSFAKPNFHSTSDCCCKEYELFCCMSQSSYLNPLVGVGHHSNQEVDEDHRGDQHVEPKHKLSCIYPLDTY